MNKNSFFTKFTRAVAWASGRPASFALAFGVILIWGISGPLFGFSDTWQLVVNTATTVVTFLMVFLIQATQNRDTAALQIKLDELIRVTEGAHNAIIDLEELNEDELQTLSAQYCRLAEHARAQVRAGRHDTDKPAIRLFDRQHRHSAHRTPL